MATSYTQQPNDVLDYDIDMASWFKSDPTDDIDTVTYTIESAQEAVPTLELGPVPHEATVLIGAQPVRFKAWIAGGTVNTDYKITFLVTTEQGRKKEVEMKIKVRDR
jgi:hypothetical protein